MMELGRRHGILHLLLRLVHLTELFRGLRIVAASIES